MTCDKRGILARNSIQSKRTCTTPGSLHPQTLWSSIILEPTHRDCVLSQSSSTFTSPSTMCHFAHSHNPLHLQFHHSHSSGHPSASYLHYSRPSSSFDTTFYMLTSSSLNSSLRSHAFLIVPSRKLHHCVRLVESFKSRPTMIGFCWMVAEISSFLSLGEMVH